MKNSELLKLILKELSWKADIQIKLSADEVKESSAVSVIYSSKERVVKSFGQGATKDEAVFKGVMELLERLSFFNHKSDHFFQEKLMGKVEKTKVELDVMYPGAKNWLLNTSSGFAIHTDKKLAVENATNELIERHVILKALLKNIYPRREETESIDGIQSDYFYWQGPVGKFVSVFRALKNDKTVYGFGSSKSLKASKEKAVLEATPRLGLLLKDNTDETLVLSDNENFNYHFYENTEETKGFFSQATEDKIPAIDSNLGKDSVWFSKVNVPISDVLKKHLFAVRAVSPRMQPHFSGKWRDEVINPLAVGECESFPKDLHILG